MAVTRAPRAASCSEYQPVPHPASSTRFPCTSGSIAIIAGRSYSALYGAVSIPAAYASATES